ncbi:NAD(P) transhydrogenase subunit alpha [Pacificimonas flava]|uniref:proton-translocating NAD(P)(+) transhydrogenase n=2 Tax=Pacificimonas TaxID=1960290 RepID=A0A219B3X9_9SPHN|nr:MULTISPECIES: Re/Si-specific NAD(P)(+) transhydrogenase subunit alpha [Pacificimonas]MBZ6377209.1 Re/Si-specific NAD(P)(+) transhydrogenase subunit alpha [Pacificimonas aurantium]OWV33070.1 NAD(P) transhydrogenase subunit alpha [Pacificimonas flava]
MKIAVLAEDAPGEARVAATPETVKKFAGWDAEVAVEAGAGAKAGVADELYREAGATVAPDRAAAIAGADVILAVRAPAAASLAGAKDGAVLAAILNPFQARETLDAYAQAGVTAIAMDFLPRITRAQSMDVLSSQANLAGYKAVVDAASAYGRAFPMMMTAAGTVSAAKVFIMGVGVAGLQAIATARRLGAQVSATDVRAATKEQIESLGAKAIFVEEVEGIEGEGTGGYASEMSEEYQQAQAKLVSEHIAKQDIVITTALIPGRPAPRLVSDAQIASMKPGGIIVDLAAPQGGNVEGMQPDRVAEVHGVRILAPTNINSSLAEVSSQLYARNMWNFFSAFWDEDAKALAWPDDDEIVTGARVVHGGVVGNPRLDG